MALGLSGKVALVTGAGRGLGAAAALALGREGASPNLRRLPTSSLFSPPTAPGTSPAENSFAGKGFFT